MGTKNDLLIVHLASCSQGWTTEYEFNLEFDGEHVGKVFVTEREDQTDITLELADNNDALERAEFMCLHGAQIMGCYLEAHKQ